MRLLFSPRVPLRVVLFVTPVIDRVPEEPERTVMLLVYVPAREEVSVALLLPLVFPSTIAPVPNAALLVEPVEVPLRMVRPPVKVFAPDSLRVEVALSWTTPVTLVPMGALIKTLPVPLPELVIVPVLLTDAVEIVVPLAVEPSFLKIRLPVPVMPPVRVNVPFWLVSVVATLLTAKDEVMFPPTVELFCVMPVTFDPTPAPLIVKVPDPVLEFVIVPL